MNIKEHDRLMDEIIGEAALHLLQERGPINTQTLIAKLLTMEASESENDRRKAISQVISQLTTGHFGIPDQGGFSESSEPERDNVYSLFGGEKNASGSKKH